MNLWYMTPMSWTSGLSVDVCMLQLLGPCPKMNLGSRRTRDPDVGVCIVSRDRGCGEYVRLNDDAVESYVID